MNSVGAILRGRFVQKLYLRMKGLDFYVQTMPPSPVHIRGQMSMYVDIFLLYAGIQLYTRIVISPHKGYNYIYTRFNTIEKYKRSFSFR